MSATKDQSPHLPLNQMIQIVRGELLEAVRHRESQKQRIEFTLEEIKLEINFVVEQAEKIDAGVSSKFWVIVGLNAGAEKAYKREEVHKVELTLRAIDKNAPSPAPGEAAGKGTPAISDVKPVHQDPVRLAWGDSTGTDAVDDEKIKEWLRSIVEGGSKVKLDIVRDGLAELDPSETSLINFNTKLLKKTGYMVVPTTVFSKGIKVPDIGFNLPGSGSPLNSPE